jgi:hypothetical protein
VRYIDSNQVPPDCEDKCGHSCAQEVLPVVWGMNVASPIECDTAQG